MIKAYEIKITGIDRTIKSLADLKEAQKAVNREMDNVAIGSRRYEELKRASIELKATQTLLRRDVAGAASEVAKSAKVAGAAEGSYVKLKARLKQLEEEYFRLGNSAEHAKRKLEISDEVKRLRAEIDKLRKELGRDGIEGAFVKSLTNTKVKIADLATLLTSGAIIGALRFFGNAVRSIFTGSIEGANKQQKAQEALLVSLKGNIEAYESLVKLAGEFQSKTIVGDEQILQIEALAINMGVTEDRMSDFITAVLNVQTVTDADFISTAKNVAKTFAGMRGELGELIPQLSTLSKEELKAGKAVDLLNALFAGQAEAAAKVGTGPLKQVQNLLGDLGEQIGGLALDVFNFFSGGIKDGVNSAISAMKRLRESTGVIVAGISASFFALKESFKTVVTDIKIGANKIKQAYHLLAFSLLGGAEHLTKATEAQQRISELIGDRGINTADAFRKKYKEVTEQFSQFSEEQERAREELKKYKDLLDKLPKGDKTRVEQLQKQQKALNDSILNAIATGQDYEEQIKRLVKVSNELKDAQLEMQKALSEAQGGTLEALKQQISIIDQQIAQTVDAQELSNLLEQKTILEQGLAEAERRIKELRQQVISGADLSELSPADAEARIRAAGNIRAANAIALFDDEKQLNNELARIKFETEKQLLEYKLSNAVKGSEEEANLIRQLAELEKSEAERVKQAKISSIESDVNKERDLKIAGAISVFDKEKELNNAIAEIKFNAEKQLLEAKIANAKKGSEEEAALIRQLAELELAEANRVAEEKKKLEEGFREAGLNIAQSSLATIFEMDKKESEDALNSRLSAIEEEYNARINAASENAAFAKYLEKEKEKELLKAQAEAAKEKKRIAKSEAIINAALAAVKTYANLGYPAAIPFVIALAATTAIQIAKIDAQKFASGGYTGKGLPYTDETGHRVAGVVHAGEYVVPNRVLRTKEGAALTKRLEELRVRAGLGSYSIPNSYATGGFVTAPSQGTAIIYAKAEFDEEQVAEIAAAVAVGSRVGSERGISKAGESAVVSLSREKSLTENIQR